MKFALTYDLKSDYKKLGYSEEDIAEFDLEETIDGIENAIRRCGHETERVGNIYSLVSYLSSGNTPDAVFNIAEGLRGLGREAQVPALLDAYGIPYVFSDTVILALCLEKSLTKRIVRDIGLATADFALVERLEDVDKINMPFPLFAKPVAEGTGKGIGAISKITSKAELFESCKYLLEKFKQGVLVERYLSGREFTVGIVGTGSKARVIGAMEVLFENGDTEAYSYHNKKNYQDAVKYVKIDDASFQSVTDLALSAWRGLGCRDGGRIDVRCDDDARPCFIEVNPLAGLNPEDSDLPIIARMYGIDFDELIRMIIESAIERIGG